MKRAALLAAVIAVFGLRAVARADGGTDVPPANVAPECWSHRASTHVIVANLPRPVRTVNSPEEIPASWVLCSPVGEQKSARKVVENLPTGVEIMSDPKADPGRREASAQAFASLFVSYRLLYEPARKPLRALLKEKDRGLRRAAAVALAHYGEIKQARQILLDESEFKLLAELGDRDAIPAIRSALQAPAFGQRSHALFALVKFGESPDGLVPFVRTQLAGEKDEMHRIVLVGALGEMSGTATHELLKEVIKNDPSEAVRDEAEEALGKSFRRSLPGGER